MGRGVAGLPGGGIFVLLLLLVVALLALIANGKGVQIFFIELTTANLHLKTSELVDKPFTNATRFRNITPENIFGKAMMEQLVWKDFESSLAENDQIELINFVQKVFNPVFSFVIMEPKSPINVTCKAPPLLSPQLQETTSFFSPLTSNLFNGSLRPAPRKVAHTIRFGFDVDTLKILLHELIDVVNKFFIVEWTMPHNQNLNPKPLAWEAVKGQAWFAFAQGR